ncbi:class I SAM-dependent methyltransferase [Candidatus Thioglobus sp.]|nr:class I SAM-dependent methyltransferase [Candidatus Thioglobus sp.]
MCDSQSLIKIVSLSPTPPGNDFLSEEELDRNEATYPLDLFFCEECTHVQLGHVVDPEILYQKNYSYVSATSMHFVNHLKMYASDMVKRFKLKPGDLVADIGSNDGTCLKFFKEKGMKVVGIDPAKDIAEKASVSGINTISDFFGYEISMELRKTFGSAKFITSHNACAHIDDLYNVIKGVKYWLKQDGVFVLEVGYLVDVYTNTWFDTIYHEHLDYHTVAPFQNLFSRAGMEIISVQRISPQGGSIRVMAQKIGGSFSRDSSVNDLIHLEKKLGLNKAKNFEKFTSKISDVRIKLQKLITSLKNDGKTIVGFGAPTKATTLMTHFGLDETVFDFIVDDNPLKQGLYTPISHIPILSADAIYEYKPDYILILAWNFAEPIMKIHKSYSDNIGKFIIPMPEPEIV